MKILFHPPKSNNDYINLLIAHLEKEGIQIINKENNSDLSFILKALFGSKKNFPKLMHLNWIEENAALPGIKAKIKCKLLMILFKIYKKSGGKIVWTLHNSKSHKQNAINQDKFISQLLKLTDLVLIHTKQSQMILNYFDYNKEILYVPIGNYYETMSQHLLPKNLSPKKPTFFYFGTIAPYKGISRLLEIWNNDSIRTRANLIVWGKPNNEIDSNELMQLARRNESVLLKLDYIDDKTLAYEFSKCDIAIFPFNKDSMQNSASAIMALTCATPVLTSEFGYMLDIKEEPFVFTYDYCNEFEHRESLMSMILKVISIWEEDSTSLVNLGKQAQSFALKYLDWNNIIKEIVNKYELIVGDKNEN